MLRTSLSINLLTSAAQIVIEYDKVDNDGGRIGNSNKKFVFLVVHLICLLLSTFHLEGKDYYTTYFDFKDFREY